MNKSGYLFLVLLIFLSSEIFGQEVSNNYIDLDLWTEVTETLPTVNNNNPSYLTDNKIYHRTLEDALWIISGMLYGYTVSYTPLDLSRKVNENLEITPFASIPWGDNKLKIVDTWVKNGKFNMQVRYFPNEAQTVRIKLWTSNIYPNATGTGVESIFSGYKGRVKSIKTGIKEALRNYFRIRYINKPREINCKVLIKNPPYTTLDAGGYRSKVTIIIKLSEIIPYSYY